MAAQPQRIAVKWSEVGEVNCSVARTLSVVGDRWTLLVLRNAFLGVRRFDDFYASLGVTRHVLASRLARLVECGVFDKVSYQARPPRFEYRLTEKGRDLYGVIATLAMWGDRWMDEGRGAPLLFKHLNCGKRTHPQLVCSECGERIDPRHMQVEPGPGI
jgi:DNA-binding HxlR family transcriptional regulator